ncbi:hypothetical protein QO009_001667 [Brevibacillus aydinogluensis]|jgi:hypothetical protein|uniref:DUF1540 domain-containing protein n=1 Tax=Brevibacillus aydinogluensis TaxID=927786 RepID=A0AA48M4Y0_9BACL|nr:hypothetical protein [Brevibacillus aydinogluensis]CAJ1001366.1 DUF1540 domain-containing protein [Brevibacillus aydinogluensis]
MKPGNRHDAVRAILATDVQRMHGANSCRNKSILEDKGETTRRRV